LELLFRECYADMQACSRFDDVVTRAAIVFRERAEELRREESVALVEEPERDMLAEVRSLAASLAAEVKSNELSVFFEPSVSGTRRLRADLANGGIADWASVTGSSGGGGAVGDSLRTTIQLASTIVASGQRRLARLDSAIAKYDSIRTSSHIQADVYPQLYRYLARLPLPESVLPLAVRMDTSVVAESHKHGKYRKETITTSVRGNLSAIQRRMLASPTEVMRLALVNERLLPWARYFCQESVTHVLCEDVGSLETYASEIALQDSTLIRLLAQSGSYSSARSTSRKSRRGGSYRL
jgi:hypothetical protein